MGNGKKMIYERELNDKERNEMMNEWFCNNIEPSPNPLYLKKANHLLI